MKLVSRVSTMKELNSKIVVPTIFIFGIVKTVLALSESVEEKVLKTYEDADITVMQLIKKYGYNGEIHHVTTDDGYILEMHRIRGPNSNPNAKGKQPILMLHALLSSSVDWLITGPGKAFAYILADVGYDVWLGNFRGNKFSRKHKKYSNLDKAYWQFSWHESGVSDLPAMIDYVLENTSRQRLIYVGHSQGTTAFWVMATQRPEYQDKVKAMFALAPVAYLSHIRSPFYRVLAHFGNNIEKAMSLLGFYEFEPSGELLKLIAGVACDDESWTQPICSNIIFMIAGFGSDQMNTTMLPVILAHAPAGGSVKQVIHFVQIVRDHKFQHYDHGMLGNLKKYHRFTPPVYKLSKVKVPVSLHYSSNDSLSDPLDVERLYRELGNPIGKYRVPHEGFAHLDFIWGKDSKELLYDKVIGLMKKYTD